MLVFEIWDMVSYLEYMCIFFLFINNMGIFIVDIGVYLRFLLSCIMIDIDKVCNLFIYLIFFIDNYYVGIYKEEKGVW